MLFFFKTLYAQVNQFFKMLYNQFNRYFNKDRWASMAFDEFNKEDGEYPLDDDVPELLVLWHRLGKERELGQSLLHVAVKLENQSALEKLLEEKDIDLESRNEMGRTPLFEALASELLGMADLLLSAGAQLGAQDRNGKNIFHFFADLEWLSENSPLVTWFSDRKVDADTINAPDQLGHPPLYYCLGKLESNLQAKMLRQKGASLDPVLEFTDQQGKTFLHHPPPSLQWISEEKLESKYLEARDGQGLTPLLSAVLEKKTRHVELLVKAGAQLDARDDQNRSILHLIADFESDLYALQYYLGFSNMGTERPRAVEWIMGQPSRGNLGLDDKDAEDRTALDVALARGNLGFAAQLIAAGARLPQNVSSMMNLQDEKGRTLWHHLADSAGEFEPVPESLRVLSLVDSELKEEPDFGLHLQDQNGHPPLYEVLRNGNTRFASVLVALGASLNASDGNGTVLHALVRTILNLLKNPAQDNRVVQQEYLNVRTGLFWLLRQLRVQGGAVLDARDQAGNGAFDLIKGQDSNVKQEITLEFIRAGASFKPEEADVLFLLHQAIKETEVDLVSLFIEKDVDLDLQNEKGESPLYLAMRKENLFLVARLLQAGADPNLIPEGEATLFELAYRSGNSELVRVILRETTKQDRRDWKLPECLPNDKPPNPASTFYFLKSVAEDLMSNQEIETLNRVDALVWPTEHEKIILKQIVNAAYLDDEELLLLIWENHVRELGLKGDRTAPEYTLLGAIQDNPDLKPEILRFLISEFRIHDRKYPNEAKKMDFTELNPGGQSILGILCDSRNEECIRILLEEGADLFFIPAEGERIMDDSWRSRAAYFSLSFFLFHWIESALERACAHCTTPAEIGKAVQQWFKVAMEPKMVEYFTVRVGEAKRRDQSAASESMLCVLYKKQTSGKENLADGHVLKIISEQAGTSAQRPRTS